MMLGSFSIDRTRCDTIAGDTGVSYSTSKTVGELVQGQFADGVDASCFVGSSRGDVDDAALVEWTH